MKMNSRFWNRKTMLSHGFQVLGIDFGNNDTYHYYITYFPEKYAMLFFNSHENKMSLFFLTKEKYEDFQKGEFAITQKIIEDGRKGLGGYVLKFIPYIDINAEINRNRIENKSQMKKAIIVANKIVEEKKI